MTCYPKWATPKEEDIKKVDVKPVRISWQCPECLMGMMEQTGYAWPMNPMGYHHKCTSCGYIGVPFGAVKFPRIEYEEV